MAKNVNHVSHAKSKQIVDGKPKLPQASSLIEGEIAINFAKGVETISTKNESGDVVTFSSDNYYTEQKLGSGFTGENSGKTVTEAIGGKSNTGHTHVSSEITGMGGYTKPSTTSAIVTGDTLNGAIGKLEKGFDNITANIDDLSGQSETIAAALVDLNTKLTEALENANTALANANAALEALSGHTIKALTQADYDALIVKDPNTVYMITN